MHVKTLGQCKNQYRCMLYHVLHHHPPLSPLLSPPLLLTFTPPLTSIPLDFQFPSISNPPRHPQERIAEAVERRIIDAMAGPNDERDRASFRDMYRQGQLDNTTISVDMPLRARASLNFMPVLADNPGVGVVMDVVLLRMLVFGRVCCHGDDV